MILFLEGPDAEQLANTDFGDGIYKSVHVFKDRKNSFADSIIHIASLQELPSKYPQVLPPNQRKFLAILVNFFSKGCENLSPEEKRGIERIALGANALELHSDISYTRFLHKIDVRDKTIDLVGIVQRCLELPNYSGIGNLEPGNVLIIGERPGKKAYGKNTPFVGDGTGKWLLKQLEAAGIREDKYYWINAYDVDGNVTSPMFIFDLKPSKIIALGTIAAKWAMPWNIIKEIPLVRHKHPSYWLRFKSKEPYPLIAELQL